MGPRIGLIQVIRRKPCLIPFPQTTSTCDVRYNQGPTTVSSDANPCVFIVEQYREGYPQLAAFVKLDRCFSTWKRFDYLHIRNLHGLQDELVELELRLNALDSAEAVRLNLSSRRQNTNHERTDLLAQIRLKIEQYGTYIYLQLRLGIILTIC